LKLNSEIPPKKSLIRRESSRIQNFFKTLNFYQEQHLETQQLSQVQDQGNDKEIPKEDQQQPVKRKVKKKRRSHSFNLKSSTNNNNDENIYYKIEYRTQKDDTNSDVEIDFNQFRESLAKEENFESKTKPSVEVGQTDRDSIYSKLLHFYCTLSTKHCMNFEEELIFLWKLFMTADINREIDKRNHVSGNTRTATTTTAPFSRRKRTLVKTNSFCNGLNDDARRTQVIQSYLQRRQQQLQQQQQQLEESRRVLKRSVSTVSDVYGLRTQYQSGLR
jgi:hypothetical protein